jgi:hypothetical protein
MKIISVVSVALTVMALFIGTASFADEFPILEGYVLQELELARGRIAMPEDWYFTESPGSSSVRWTISKEDANIGPYETGLSIQLFLNVKENTGGTPRQLIEKNLKMIASANSLVSECPESKQGSFNRRCIEVIENQVKGDGSQLEYHTLYSFLWWEDGDIAVVTVFGTTPDLWDSTEEIRAVMSRFDFLSLEEKKPSQSAN